MGILIFAISLSCFLCAIAPARRACHGTGCALLQKRAQQRTGLPANRFRPWLQAFRDYAFDRRPFTEKEIRAQIKATEDFGSSGVRFLARDFIPRTSRYAHRLCHGIQVMLVDRQALDTPALGIEIASAIFRFHPRTFELHKTLGLIGARWVVQAIKNSESPAAIAERWHLALEEFRSRRSAHLLY